MRASRDGRDNRGRGLGRRGQHFDFRHRERLASERRIAAREPEKAERERNSHSADDRTPGHANSANRRRSQGARGKTERFVQFVPHLRRRPSFLKSQGRQ